MPGRRVATALNDVDAVATGAGAEAAARPQRKVTHLALDPAWHGAAAT
jgi:hypothetical protein